MNILWFRNGFLSKIDQRCVQDSELIEILFSVQHEMLVEALFEIPGLASATRTIRELIIFKSSFYSRAYSILEHVYIESIRHLP